MCEYCKGEVNKCFKVKPHNNNIIQPNEAMISNLKKDTPGIILFQNNFPSGYFDVLYCPFCGRKLDKEVK